MLEETLHLTVHIEETKEFWRLNRWCNENSLFSRPERASFFESIVRSNWVKHPASIFSFVCPTMVEGERKKEKYEHRTKNIFPSFQRRSSVFVESKISSRQMEFRKIRIFRIFRVIFILNNKIYDTITSENNERIHGNNTGFYIFSDRSIFQTSSQKISSKNIFRNAATKCWIELRMHMAVYKWLAKFRHFTKIRGKRTRRKIKNFLQT